MSYANIPLLVITLVTIIAALTDIIKFKIYNALTIPTLLAGLITASMLGGLGGLCQSLLGALVGFGVLVVFFAMGGVGAGDVKLFTALCAWLGPEFTLQVFVAAAIASALYGLALVVLRGGLAIALTDLSLLGYRMLTPSQWKRPRSRIEDEVRRSDRRTRLVPFGAMTCVGFLAMVVACWQSQNLVSQSVERVSAFTPIPASSPGGQR